MARPTRSTFETALDRPLRAHMMGRSGDHKVRGRPHWR